MEKIIGRIMKRDTVDNIMSKRLFKNLQLKIRGCSVHCPKCNNIAEKIPLKRLSSELLDYLTELNVFHCFAYWCDYCRESDIEILTYF